MSKSWQPKLPPARVYKKENLQELQKISQFIYQIGEDPQLRLPSKIVAVEDINNPEIKAKIAYLKKCMLRYKKATNGKGRGIAAVQVGIPERFFLFWRDEQKEKMEVWINPVITKKAEKLYRYPEACMSCNSLVAPVIRPAWVEVEYYTERGDKKRWSLKDTTKKGKIENRVIQHEIDHLDGIINIDRVGSKELVFETDKEYATNRFITVKK